MTVRSKEWKYTSVLSATWSLGQSWTCLEGWDWNTTKTSTIRVDHISKSVSNVDSKLFIPFQYIRIYTKKIFSHIGTDLGVPQGGSNFTKGLIRANMLKTRKWPYLAWFSSKLKNKTTFFSSTLKVWQNKVVLFFHFKP